MCDSFPTLCPPPPPCIIDVKEQIPTAGAKQFSNQQFYFAHQPAVFMLDIGQLGNASKFDPLISSPTIPAAPVIAAGYPPIIPPVFNPPIHNLPESISLWLVLTSLLVIIFYARKSRRFNVRTRP